MRNSDIEAWTLGIVDQVLAHQPVEDARVELKAKWVDAVKAARRLAGHANAARGEEILWLIGIDEENGVVGAEANELSSWWPRVQAQFNGVAPSCTDINVPTGEGRIVVALYFETDRAPYVVKNPDGQNPIQFEVPWREGTLIRTARRDELLKILVPARRIPQIKLTGGELRVSVPAREDAWYWTLSLDFYIKSHIDSLLVIPFSDTFVTLDIDGFLTRQEMSPTEP